MGSVHRLTRTLSSVSTEISLHAAAYRLQRVTGVAGIRKTVKAMRLAGA
jgi:hypothetical protein